MRKNAPEERVLERKWKRAGVASSVCQLSNGGIPISFYINWINTVPSRYL